MTDAVADATPPKKGEKRQRQGATLVRWDEAEGQIVAAKAERSGLSMAGYFRAAALGDAGPRAVRRPPAEKAELIRLQAQLGRINGNANQLAHVANVSGNIEAIAELRSIRENLVLMRQAVMHALGRGPTG